MAGVPQSRFSYQWVGDVMRSRSVRKAIHAKAVKVAAQARAIAKAENIDLDIEVVDLTRPKGRPEARVLTHDNAQEWGDSKTERRRILGRAAESA